MYHFERADVTENKRRPVFAVGQSARNRMVVLFRDEDAELYFNSNQGLLIEMVNFEIIMRVVERSMVE